MDEAIRQFVGCDRALLTAPAGHGKTHVLTDCVRIEHELGRKPLLLTHTHAGIASIKEKMKSKDIPSNWVHIETIMGFAQRFVLSYSKHTELPTIEDKSYFLTIITKATSLFERPLLRKVLSCSYDSLYVDEFQDCSKQQYVFIDKLSNILPIHLLGDELQGIYDFEDLVSFNSDLLNFQKFNFLTIPWRWQNTSNCAELGQKIYEIRKKIEEQGELELMNYQCESIIIKQIKEEKDVDFYLGVAPNIAKIQADSVLMVIPNKASDGHIISTSERADILLKLDYSHNFKFLDAIDEKKYYGCSKEIDDVMYHSSRIRKRYKKICDILDKLTFNSSAYTKWIDDSHIIHKKEPDSARSRKLSEIYNAFWENPSHQELYELISIFRNELRCKIKRPGLYHSVMKALKDADSSSVTAVYDNMVRQKNIVRQTGRKISGRCFGTTLLTKGLEFDNVIILNAQDLDKKNFYVAISRACKKLVIFTRSTTLNFSD